MEGSLLGEAGGEGEAAGASEWPGCADGHRELAGPGASGPVSRTPHALCRFAADGQHQEMIRPATVCRSFLFPVLLAAEAFVHKRDAAT